jgi:hypothetical protein
MMKIECTYKYLRDNEQFEVLYVGKLPSNLFLNMSKIWSVDGTSRKSPLKLLLFINLQNKEYPKCKKHATKSLFQYGFIVLIHPISCTFKLNWDNSIHFNEILKTFHDQLAINGSFYYSFSCKLNWNFHNEFFISHYDIKIIHHTPYILISFQRLD